MVLSEIVTLFIYAVSMTFLPEYFGTFHSSILRYPLRLNSSTDLSFVVSTRFAWKVAVIVAISAIPLYIIKLIRSRVAPAASSKLL